MPGPQNTTTNRWK